ncbi:MAG: TIGR02186 family protein [Rhodospirillaceae bacterium]|nr:TIGR02186 family protein [Rhodospirillaceae bacterium]MBT6117907.1 TIGR02186 family protein [Rhodospirillaceae bacterium]
MRRLVLPSLALAAAFGALSLAWTGARAQGLVADLSDHFVAITAGFTGTDVLLFGALDEEGDVAVVVRGPEQDVVVRRKDRIAGVWANADELTFEAVPTFYAIAANRPLDDLAPRPVLERNQIGMRNIRFNAMEPDVTEVETARFIDAFIRIQKRQRLYSDDLGTVTFMTGRLFRSRLVFPSNVPVGVYTVQVFLIRDGEVLSAQTTPLNIDRTGIGAEIFLFAHRHAAAYGALAILSALVAGWLAGQIFKRR